MSYNLYIDDIRNPPTYDTLVTKEGLLVRNWVIARTVGQAATIVRVCGWPTFMSLDHDLGETYTVMQFLHWLAKWGDLVQTPPTYVVHSANPVGRDNIISFMESWKKSMQL